MMVHLLASDGEEMDCTNDVPAEKWVNDFHIAEMRARGITANDPGRRIAEAEVLITVSKIIQMDDDAPLESKQKLLVDLLKNSVFYWLTGVLDEFDEKSQAQDGFVKIFDDHVEWGWMERRDPRKLN